MCRFLVLSRGHEGMHARIFSTAQLDKLDSPLRLVDHREWVEQRVWVLVALQMSGL